MHYKYEYIIENINHISVRIKYDFNDTENNLHKFNLRIKYLMVTKMTKCISFILLFQ